MRPGVPQRRRGLPARRSKPRARLHVVPAPVAPAEAPTDWQALTEALLERCGGFCEACGSALPSRWVEWDRHHRKLRSQGGRDVLSNLVAVHSGCHVVAPQAIHQRPAWARERGLIVRQAADPRAAVLWLPDGRMVLLSDEGPYEVLMEGEPAP